MVERVNSDEIEGIVGTHRRRYYHIGYADSKTQTFYIMHSELCLQGNPDLTLCEYSLALGAGKINIAFENEPGLLIYFQDEVDMIELNDLQ